MKHPKGLYLLFFTEMWERFSYYGMRAIFALYMLKALLFDKALVSNIYGSYTGLVYLTPLIGGYIADRYWGNRRCIIRGGLLMAVGQLFMFLSALYYMEHNLALILMYCGLGFLIFGNGFFKPNITTMVGQLYEEKDIRKDSAYTIFYMGINVGAFLSPLVAGALGDTGDPADFKWGFLAACIGMLIGTCLFWQLQNKYLVAPDGKAIGISPNITRDKSATEISEKKSGFPVKRLICWTCIEIALFLLFYKVVRFDFIGSAIFSLCLVAPGFIITDPSLSKIERQRIWVIYIISFFVIFFWAAFEQAGASLTFFADEQTDRFIGDWEMPASFFQVFNALFIILLAPLFSFLWIFLKKKKLEISAPAKQAIGLFLLSMGYLVIAFGVRNVAPEVKVSMLWLVSLYFIHTVGELCLSPIGLSIVNQLAPARFASLLMAIWFLSLSTANKFAGMLSSLYPEPNPTGFYEPPSFLGYSIENLFDFFMLFVVMSGVASVILFVLTRKLQKMMHEE